MTAIIIFAMYTQTIKALFFLGTWLSRTLQNQFIINTFQTLAPLLSFRTVLVRLAHVAY